MVNLKTLVLDNNYQPQSMIPLSIIPAQNAFKKVFAESARAVYNYDRKILTPRNLDFYYPSVIALNGFYHRKKVNPVMSKYRLLVRDDWKCQYCQTELSMTSATYDHVLPRSKGGKTNWENIVAACRPCNSKKGHDPKNKWAPITVPKIPTIFELNEKRKSQPIVIHDARWMDFLSDWKAEIRVSE